MISLNRIRFCGIFSNELNMPDLIMDCAFDSDNSEVSTFLTREAVSSESYDGRNRRINSFKYTENFAPKFTFIKKDFGDFSQEEVRTLLKYLTSRDTTGLLEAYDDDSNVISWASIGNFSEIQLYKIANKRVVGVTAVWDSISPFAFSDLYSVTKTISSAENDNKITIEIDTDDNKPVYPRIKVQHLGSVVRISDGKNYSSAVEMNLDGRVENTAYFNGETYYWMSAEVSSSTTQPDYDWDIITVEGDYTGRETIKNNKIYHYTKTNMYYWIDPYYFHKSSADNPPNLATTSVKLTNTHTDFFNQSTVLGPTNVKNNNATEIVIIDGANQIISSDSANRVFDDDFNWTWLPLLDGKNEIAVEGNCTVTLEWREVRKVGEF